MILLSLLDAVCLKDPNEINEPNVMLCDVLDFLSQIPGRNGSVAVAVLWSSWCLWIFSSAPNGEFIWSVASGHLS